VVKTPCLRLEAIGSPIRLGKAMVEASILFDLSLAQAPSRKSSSKNSHLRLVASRDHVETMGQLAAGEILQESPVPAVGSTLKRSQAQLKLC